MTHDQTFTLRPDGGYDIQPAGVLLLLGREISTTPPSPLRAKLEGHVQAFLMAAHAGGFKKTDVLETLLARGDTCKRVLTICHEALCRRMVAKPVNKNLPLLSGAGIQAGIPRVRLL